MPSFDDIRNKFPSAKNLSDEEIISKVSSLTGLPLEQVSNDFGYNPEKERGMGGALWDYTMEGGKAVLGAGKAATDLVAPGSYVSKKLGAAIEQGNKEQSLYTQIEQQKLAKTLESEGLGEQASGVWDYISRNPGLSAAQAIGNLVAPGAAIKGARGAAAALNLGAKGTAALGTAAGMATSGVLAGGDAAGDAYDAVYRANESLPEVERKRVATEAAREASVVPGVVGMVAGRFGAEKALAQGVTKSILKTGLAEFGSEFVEEGVTKLSANIAAGRYGADVSPGQGVFGTALLGGIQGAGTGTAVGMLTKEKTPPSLLGGSTETDPKSSVNQDGSGIGKAINENDAYTSNTYADSLLKPINPYDVGGHVSAFKQGADTSIDQAQQGLFGGIPEQQATMQSEQVAQASKEQQAAVAEQQRMQRLASLATTYGIKATEQSGVYNLGGKPIFGQDQVNNFLSLMDTINRSKTPEYKDMFGSTLRSGVVKLKPDATPKTAVASVDKFLNNWGLADAPTKEDAATRVEAHIGAVDKDKDFKVTGMLNDLYKTLTGTDSPTFLKRIEAAEKAVEKPTKVTGRQKLTQQEAPAPEVAPATEGQLVVPEQQSLIQKGSTNGQLQLQNAPRVGEVPIQGRTTEAGTERTGLLQPGNVQPVGARSIIKRPIGKQAGQPSTEGIRTGAIERTTRGRSVDEVGQRSRQGQISESISQEEARTEFRNIMDEAFGTRNAAIIYDVMFNDMSQTEVGKKYKLTGERVNQIAGSKAQQTYGPRFFATAKRLGYTPSDLENLSLAINGQVEQAKAEGRDTVYLEDQEAQALSEEEAFDQQREAGIQQAEEVVTGESKLGGEDIYGDEEDGGSSRGMRVFGGETGAGEVGIEDASSRNKTLAKYKKEGTKWDKYQDYELQNLIADEIAAPDEIQGIVAEITSREKIRVRRSKALGDKSNIIEGEGLFKEVGPEEQRLMITDQTSKLSDAQIQRLEEHYQEDNGTDEFLDKVREDVIKYVTKGAQAVSAKIRDIIRQIASGVMAVAVVFNTSHISPPYAYAVPAYDTTQVKVTEQVPAAVADAMSEAAKRAYELIMPAIKADPTKSDKLFVITDKPTATTFMFTSDGKVIFQEKTLQGAALGDYYKGNNDIKANRITPAGRYTLERRTATKSTHGYDYDTVYGVTGGGQYFMTLMHSVWLKETDAKQRQAALKSTNAADSRYSFGCINIDTKAFGNLLSQYRDQMDGATLFVVPDNQAEVMDFINGKAVKMTDMDREGTAEVTKTVTTPSKKAQKSAAAEVVGKEEEALTLSEKAAQAWDRRAAQYGLPQYADLPVKSRDEWNNAVETGNTTLADMNTVFNKMEKTTKLASKSTPFFFDEVESKRGFDSIRDDLKAAGIENALDFVSDWVLDPALADGQGSIESIGGRYVVSIRNDPSYTPQFIAETARHEIGHAVDMAPQGGIYSAQPEMGVVLKGGVITPTGKVAKELFGLYNTSSRWKNFLSYPFDTKANPELNTRVKIESEIFAQAFTAYTTPAGKALMQEEAPITAAYLEEVLNDIKSTKALQIQTARTANQRLTRFQNRNAPERTQTDVGTVREGNEKLLSRANERVDVLRDKTQQRIDKMPPAYKNSAQKLFDFLTEGKITDRFMASVKFTRSLVEAASARGLKSAVKYWKLDQQRQQVLGRHMAKIESVLENFKKLPDALQGTGKNTVNGFLKDSTLDSKWGFQPSWLKNDVAIDQEYARRFEALPKEAQQVIKDVFKYYYDVNQDMKKVVLETTSTEFDALIKAAKEANDSKSVASLEKQKAASISQYQTLLQINAEKPYAALKRFGNIVMVGKSEAYVEAEKANDTKKLKELETRDQDYIVKFYESRSEALADYRAMQGKYEYLTKPFDSADASESSVFGGRDINATFQRLRTLAESDKNDVASRGLNKLLNDLHLKLLSEQSARHSENRRRNITGADDDMMRAFASQGKASAHFLSSLQNSSKIYEALKDMRKERDSNPDTKDVTSIYYNEIMKRHGMDLVYSPTPIVDAALTATSTWMLLTSPAYFLQNATQPYLISLPYMAGRSNYDKAASALTQAYFDITSVIGKSGVSEKDYDKLPSDVKSVVEDLVNRGSINISLAAETGRFRSTMGATDDYLEKAGNAYGKGVDILRGVAENVESVNRVATAVAAYRLAKDKGDTHEQAVNYADDVIYRTHGDYSASNAPRFMRTGYGRIATQFRKFQFIQLGLIGKLFNESIKGATPEEKYVARRALGFTLGHTVAVGGLMGLPGMTAFATIAMALFGDKDEPKDAEEKLRKYLGNGHLADLIIKGAPAAMGVDLSGKLGMGNALSVLPYTDFKLTRESYAQGLVAAFGGPFFGGLGYKAIDAAQYFGAGDYYKGVESLMPKGVSDVMKGFRLGSEGVTTKRGDVLVSPEDISFATKVFQAFGLPTTSLTEAARQRSQAYAAKEFYSDKTTSLKDQYARAVRSNDTKKQGKIIEAWTELQEGRVRQGFKRQPMSTLLSAPREQIKRERETVKGVQYSRENKMYVEDLTDEEDQYGYKT